MSSWTADPSLRAACGDVGAAYGRWEEAAASFAQALAPDPDQVDVQVAAADVCLPQGKKEEHDRRCRALFRRIEEPDAVGSVEDVARCLLAVPGAGDAARLRELVARHVPLKPGNGSYPFRAQLRGMAEYRAGYDAEAVAWLNRGRDEPLTHFFLAMAQQRLRHPDAARAELALGVNALEAFQPHGSFGDLSWRWRSLAHARAVRREAEALLERK